MNFGAPCNASLSRAQTLEELLEEQRTHMDGFRLPPITTPRGSSRASAVAARVPLDPRAMLGSPRFETPSCMKAATNPGMSLHGNGRSGTFSKRFIRGQVGQACEVLHFHDASLDKATLLRELEPAQRRKAALRLQRRREVVARCEARKQREAEAKRLRVSKKLEAEQSEGQREAAAVLQRMWRHKLAKPLVTAEGEEVTAQGLDYEQAVCRLQKFMRRKVAALRAERRRRQRAETGFANAAALTIQSSVRRRSALLRCRRLAAYRQIDTAMAEVHEALRPRLREQAATQISARVRGKLTRKKIGMRQHLLGLMSNAEQLTLAALRIQSVYRGKKAREKTQKKRRAKQTTQKAPHARGQAKERPRGGGGGGPTEPGTWQAQPPAGGAPAHPRRKKP